MRRLFTMAVLGVVLTGCAPLRHLDFLSYQQAPPDCELLSEKYGYSTEQAKKKQWFACPDVMRVVEQTVWAGGTRRTTVWLSDLGRFRSQSDIHCPTGIPGPGEKKTCFQTYGSDYMKIDGSLFDQMTQSGLIAKYGMRPFVFDPKEQRGVRIREVEGTCRLSNTAGC